MQLDPNDPIYTISVVARLLQLHEQTLRQYERLGFVNPCRTIRKTRLYSQVDVHRLERITYLVRTCGMNLAGVKMIVELCNCHPEVEVFLETQTFSASHPSNVQQENQAQEPGHDPQARVRRKK